MPDETELDLEDEVLDPVGEPDSFEEVEGD